MGNLHVHITEEDLQQVFAPFGDIDNVSVVRDEMGGSKGYAFVKFARVEVSRTWLSAFVRVYHSACARNFLLSHLPTPPSCFARTPKLRLRN